MKEKKGNDEEEMKGVVRERKGLPAKLWFLCAGLIAGNSHHCMNSDSNTFKRQLKTFLFQQAYQ